MKVLVLGAGAIGGYLGGRLAEAGQDITFLVRSTKKKQLDERGLRINSVFGDLNSRVNTVTAKNVSANNDLVILACKSYHLKGALETATLSLKSDGAVLPILNGIVHLDELNSAFGPERVLGGTIKLSATCLPDGTIEHLNDWHWLKFGEQNGELSPRAKAIEKVFKSTIGLKAYASENIIHEMWEKFVHLATAASITCLMRANSGQIASSVEGASLFQEMLETSASVARAKGYPPSQTFLDNYRKLFADKTASYATSMLRDIEAGKYIEGEEIIGTMLRYAKDTNIQSTLLTAAYAHIKAYEARHKNGGKL
ncbi:MAG: 2-dehydropantoate 2-reductase [Alphaproteobacteria bacterium]|nr:2-dehydropantoate 2-reductase [Alphaproteobacteria bacterium]PPR14259.1 MAG: 2-dehydropantoate 2-reductase [Alphaproteobacteria bacterium MarineAlpha12_Bin1]|tara:strand:+ start:8859 stop:9794 length:936 start_codon:yes stop_codon:yes gene_type:complete